MEETRNILFGKYEIGRLLGRGTFAKVHYAKEIATGESVAIKVINKEKVMKEGMMEQIQREISAMRLVRHPNIVDLKEVLATKSKIYFVMEHVTSGELFTKLVAKGKLKEDAARKYFQQLISAVEFCHSRGVFHRDIKPENLLLDEKGDLKVSDFGLSALPEQFRYDGLLHTQCGTPAYVAPEVLRRKGYNGEKADIWSCGVVLYVLLAGFLPFRDENIMNMYRKIFKSEYDFPPWFSCESRKLISKLLVADPERRISIPGVMRLPWFRKSFSRHNSFTTEGKIVIPDTAVGGGGGALKKSTSSPAYLNAFEFISSMSSGFDLSSLFEDEKKVGSMFTSRFPAVEIVAKIKEVVGKGLMFKVAKEDDFKLRLEGPVEGRMGRLVVAAEVFEVAPEVAVVQFTQCGGDGLEYVKFWEEDVGPALKDIVWTWQGDNVICNGNRQ